MCSQSNKIKDNFIFNKTLVRLWAKVLIRYLILLLDCSTCDRSYFVHYTYVRTYVVSKYRSWAFFLALEKVLCVYYFFSWFSRYEQKINTLKQFTIVFWSKIRFYSWQIWLEYFSPSSFYRYKSVNEKTKLCKLKLIRIYLIKKN